MLIERKRFNYNVNGCGSEQKRNFGSVVKTSTSAFREEASYHRHGHKEEKENARKM
jgi:hypothetical protein